MKYFYTHDSKLRKHNGLKVEILRKLTASECDEEEVGSMYEVRMPDGKEIHAFDDELFDEQQEGFPCA